MAEFSFACPHCKTFMQSDVAYVGYSVECPACKQTVVIPVPGRAAPAAQQQQQSPQSRASATNRRRWILILGFVGLAVILAAAGVMLTRQRDKAPISTIPSSAASQTAREQPAREFLATPAKIKTPVSVKVKDPGPGTVAFIEDFESGIENWKVLPGASAMDYSDLQNHTSQGKKSAKVQNSSQRMYRELATAVTKHAKVSFWIWDGDQSAAFAEVRGYEIGQEIAKDKPIQNLAIGRYDGPFVGGKGKLAREAVDKTKYQARITNGRVTGWFNLNGPGAPSRSPGWHQFEIEREKDATLGFYVDGVLARRIEGALKMKWTVVTIGSLGMENSPGEAHFDDIKIVYFGTRTNSPGAKAASAPAKKRTAGK